MEEFDFSNQIQQIETLLSSNSKDDKSFGYSTLLHLQQQYNEHPSAIRALTVRLLPLISSTLSDISNNDEEIAVQALKCLGFMIYHPTLASHVTEDIADLVVHSLVNLITTTQTKAILKLATQVSEKMRDTSNIWVPLICRRLLSIDKRERDVIERCLLQIRSTICPPPSCLSKALSLDLEKKLLSEMKDMLQNPKRKFHAIQAWGWFICLLGSHVLKKKHLINEMLKIPEHTFSDSDPKMQLMSLVPEAIIGDCKRLPRVQNLSYCKTIFDPLAQWLSDCTLMHGEMQVIIINELQLLWAESLNCLQRSKPPIIFDSTFLRSHATILETTLNHSIPAISASTIAFWNWTCGMQDKLDYPQNLLPILDKLSRQGRISIDKRYPLCFINDHSTVRTVVATTHKQTSKRVGFVEMASDMECSGIRVAGLRRKRRAD